MHLQRIRDNILIVTLLIGTLSSVLVNSQQQQALQNVIELVQPFSYEAPDDCKFQKIKNQDVALACNLRTVNSEYDTTNFSVIPIDHTTSLTILCSNELKTKSRLKAKSFSHLVHLNELTLEFCKFGKLQADNFWGLGGLRNLSIRTHNIHWQSLNMEIDSGTFQNTKNLVQLDLSTNNIWSLPEGLFCSLPNLQYLNFSYNRLQFINEFGFHEQVKSDKSDEKNMPLMLPTLGPLTSTLSSADISSRKMPLMCASDLEVLDVSHNSIVALPENGFGILKRLKYLKINHNEISMLNDMALDGLRSLQVIDLSSNKFVVLPPRFFKDQSQSIQEIHLQNNSINALSPGLFSNLVQLQALYLSMNQLTSAWINNSTFKGLIRLVLLDLSSNRITKLEPQIFSDLSTLQILNLRNNMLETIEADTFMPMQNLHELLLSHNKIRRLDVHSLNGLKVLTLLSIDNNLLTKIHPETFRNCSSLQILNLNENQLTQIPLALKDMRLLQTLDLGENLITSLDEPGFRGLNKVYGLRLIGNQIQNISRAAFRELPELEILNLATNQIMSIERGTFDALHKIKAIRLDGNYLTHINGLFANMHGLLWLNVSDNRLTQFDFSQIPFGLEWLDLHINNLTELTNTYALDQQLQLKTLDVSFNHLEKITDTTFPDSIELLFLNDNLIRVVEPLTFHDKPNLLRVDLYANRITGLDKKALRLSPVPMERRLPEFYIGGNPFICDCNIEWLRAINENSREFPRIMDIDTIYCKLLNNRDKSYIPLLEAQPHQFLCGYDSHCRILCDCCGRDSCNCEMKCPTNCTCFHDQTWKTNIVECAGRHIHDVPRRMSNDVTELYLDGTNLIDLSSNSFIDKRNLAVFYGNNSNIQMIHNGTFNHLQRLMILHLANNKLQRLNGFEFNSLENLRELYLQHNKLTFIDTRTFQELKKLEVIQLHDNKLINFEIWQLTYNPYLATISLSENLWSCDCHYLNKLQIYLQSNTEKIIDLSRMTCVYNNYTNSLQEKNGTICTLKDGMSSIAYTKQIEDLLPFLLVATCAFVGCFGLILGIFCYRHELKIFIYNNCAQLFVCCCGYKSSEFLNDYNDKDRLYDAYVIYSLQDDNFVTQGLTNVLENDIGYRMCLHYRDFNLNANNYIADTICEAIDNSKRAILVLSKNFLYNEWGRFEFKGAIHEVLKRRRKLIIVLYGDIPQKDLDADIRLYLKTNLCLEWDDKKFWQKLRLALPSQIGKTTNKHCLTDHSTINIYATTHQASAPTLQYPLRSHEYNTITPVNRASTLRRGVSSGGNIGTNSMLMGASNNGGPASIRLDNYAVNAIINNCQQKICDNYEQINNCKFNTMQTANEHHLNNINRRMHKQHEYAVPINCGPPPQSVASGGLTVGDPKRNNCMLSGNVDNNNFNGADSFECNNKYSSTSSLSNGSSEFCTRSLSSPSNSRHCVDGYNNDNLNSDDVFYNKNLDPKERSAGRSDNINNLNNCNNNTANCKTMPSSYYCGNSSNAKNNNTMHHHHSGGGAQVNSKTFANAKSDKMNIVDENNMKNASGVATSDKKRRLPQSDVMWA